MHEAAWKILPGGHCTAGFSGFVILVQCYWNTKDLLDSLHNIIFFQHNNKYVHDNYQEIQMVVHKLGEDSLESQDVIAPYSLMRYIIT